MEKITFLNFKKRTNLFFKLIFLLCLVVFTSSFDSVNTIYNSDAVYIDSDGDKVPDNKDIDDDNDGIIDVVEDKNEDGDNNHTTNSTDTDGDGVPDYLDIDSDNDGILDNVEAQTKGGFQAPCGIDADRNGLDDHYEATPGSCGGLMPLDTDGDGVPDYLDIDSDNDGILDNVEAQTGGDFQAPCGKDMDGNGLDDHYENTTGSGEGLTPVDTDNDGHSDFRDIDSDNDGILDNVEAQTDGDFIAPCGIDSDGNGLDDHYEDTPGSGEGVTPINSDSDSNPNYRDIDSDNDGLPDNVEGQTTDGYIAPSGEDDDNDGLDNAYDNDDNTGVIPNNHDEDDAADYIDLDSDNDTVPDNNEGNDFDFDGIPDQVFTGIDTDGDGLDDGYEGSDVNDGFDVNDEIDNPATDLPDTDGTEDVNYRDLDDDGDGIPTADEDADGDGDPTNDDSDGDGIPDYLDAVDDREPTVNPEAEVLVIELLTPNGDGKNEFLWIQGIENFPNNSIRIFNRWGIAVYEGQGYDNQNNVFDGKSKGRSTLSREEYLPAGVYYYIFNYENLDKENITLNGYMYISK